MKKSILLILFLVASLFRFWQLTKYPVSLSMDEVAIGYNAYSILHTSKDEWGETLPLAFRSAGDYKPPVNVYLTVPSVAIFGLTEFATRLPSALLGSLSIVFLVLLLLKLKVNPKAAYLTGFWLCVLPWHIHFSRASFEAITALFFLITGTYFFISWVEKKKQLFLLLSIISFSLSVWAYHAERVFVPIFVLGLIFLYRRQIKFKKIKNQLPLAIIVLAIFAIPFIKLTFFTPAIITRASATSILKEVGLNNSLHHGSYLNIQDFIFNNDTYIVFRHWLGKYLNYFDFGFIFSNGMKFTKPGYPDLGLLYLVDIPIFILGIWFLLKNKNSLFKKLVLFWFLLGPFPASFAMNEQHSLRSLIWLPAFAFIIASGFEQILKFKRKKIFLITYYIALSINIIYFIFIYTSQFPKDFSEYWQYGYKEIAQYSCVNKDKYDEIIISDTFGSDGPLNTGLPYLYILFYCQSDPKSFYQTKTINKFNFHQISWRTDSLKPNRLIITSPWDVLDSKISEDQIIKKINFLNQKTGFLFITTNKTDVIKE
ncbi:MAG: glycosyltransferase family 39 protein [Candidatus Shapirobacteria bacterium]